MQNELEKLKNDGVGCIQIDAPRYSYFIDPKWRDWIRTEIGQEPDTVLKEYLSVDNACLEAARQPGVTLAIHLCRGNNRSHRYAEGGYDAIARSYSTRWLSTAFFSSTTTNDLEDLSRFGLYLRTRWSSWVYSAAKIPD